MLLVLALSLHSIFEGLALGLQPSASESLQVRIRSQERFHCARHSLADLPSVAHPQKPHKLLAGHSSRAIAAQTPRNNRVCSRFRSHGAYWSFAAVFRTPNVVSYRRRRWHCAH